MKKLCFIILLSLAWTSVLIAGASGLQSDKLDSLARFKKTSQAESVTVLATLTLTSIDLDRTYASSSIKLKVNGLQNVTELEFKISRPRESSVYVECEFVDASKSWEGHVENIISVFRAL